MSSSMDLADDGPGRRSQNQMMLQGLMGGIKGVVFSCMQAFFGSMDGLNKMLGLNECVRLILLLFVS